MAIDPSLVFWQAAKAVTWTLAASGLRPAAARPQPQLPGPDLLVDAAATLGERGGPGRTPPATPTSPCDALTHPKVALLFLSRGPMPLESIWHDWLGEARDYVPAPDAGEDADAAAWEDGARRCAASEPCLGVDAAACQQLFDVHVHRPANLPDDPSSPLGPYSFAQVLTRWGDISLVAAERALVRRALAEPRNQKFVLVSDNAVPLYPATVVYRQLIGETRSRVNACPHPRTQLERWHPAMGRANTPLSPRLWRKSMQWFVIGRRHAALFVSDAALYRTFRAYCSPHVDRELQRYYECFADEHYLPTLLAFHHLEGETDCTGYPMHVNWTAVVGPHPRTYRLSTLTPEAVRAMREPWAGCDDARAMLHGQAGFFDLQHQRRTPGDSQAYDPGWLGPACPLFARKIVP